MKVTVFMIIVGIIFLCIFVRCLPLLFVHYSNISIQKMYGRKNP